MNLKELKYKANYYTLLLLVFVIPLERRLGPPLIGLFVITSFFNSSSTKNQRKSVLIFGVLFLLYLLSLLYSNDLNEGVNDIIKKLSLLVFPVAIYFSKINFSTKLSAIFKSFIEGCFVSSILSLAVSGINYFFTHDTASFFYGNSSVFLHASYFAMYLNFSVLIIYYSLFGKVNGITSKFLSVFLIIFFSIMVVISSSKTGLISLVLIHGGAIVYWIAKEKAWLKGAVVVVGFVIVLSTVFITSSVLRARFNEFITVASTGKTSSGSTTAARVEIWKIAVDLIQQNPVLGYGAGDVTHQLTKKYKDHGFLYFFTKKFNSHNQYLQTTLATGVIGGLCLLLILIVPLVLSIKNQEFLYLFFLLLIIFNLMTEAMFERQTGVVFYALFNALFFTSLLNKKKRNKVAA